MELIRGNLLPAERLAAYGIFGKENLFWYFVNEQGEIMFNRHACQAMESVLLIALLSLPAYSQWEDVTSFRNVQIPFDLKIEDKIIEQGKYDIKILKQTAQGLYYLRIQKKKEKLCLIPGETIPYVDFEEIPEKPKLRMRRNPVEKMLTILFESGTITWKYSNVKVRFQIEYIE